MPIGSIRLYGGTSGCSGTVATRRYAFPASSSLPGEEAIIFKEDDRLVIELAPPRSLLRLLETLEPIDEDLPTVEELPHTPVDL
jgi:antitoxin VapB